MHTHSWRCKAKSSGHIGFADRIACLALLKKWPFHGLCPWHSLNMLTPSDKNGEHRTRGTGGDTHIYRYPSIIYQEIAYHQIPGNPLSSEAPGFLRKYQKFPDPCAKDSNLHQTNGKHKEKPHASLQNMWFSVAPQEGLEPTTLRLTAECSAIELLRLMRKRRCCSPFSTF